MSPGSPVLPPVPQEATHILRVRLGTALQKRRVEKRLTQAQLAEIADLSLKYVGEIERGETNCTLDALERLAKAVEWDPVETLEGSREPISEGVRMLMMREVHAVVLRFETMLKWLEALDPSLDTVARLALPRICMGHPVFIDAGGNITPVPTAVPPPTNLNPSPDVAIKTPARRVRRRVIGARREGF